MPDSTLLSAGRELREGNGQESETAAGTGKVQTMNTVINMSP